MNGQPIVKKLELRPGDTVEIELPPPLETEVKPVDIPVDILFEDDDVVVVNKPAGMTVHPGSGTGEDTLVHAMMFHCKGQLSMAGGAMRPGIVHRLDKETSGVMIMAKNDNAYYRLVEMFSERELDKEYIAIVSGVPNVRSGTIRKPIGRPPLFQNQNVHKRIGAGGAHRMVSYRKIRQQGGLDFVQNLHGQNAPNPRASNRPRLSDSRRLYILLPEKQIQGNSRARTRDAPCETPHPPPPFKRRGNHRHNR